MKKILLIVLLLFVGCSKEHINFEQMLVERDNVYYTKDTNKPYSGTVFSLYDDGKKKSEGAFKNGYYNGKWTSWYANGQKYTEGTFKDDYYDGKWTSWYENGQKYSEGIYKDGNVISEKCWDEVGDECECLEYSSKYEDRDAITDEQIVNDYVETVSQTISMIVESPLKLKIVTTERIWYSMAADTAAAQTGILSPREEKTLSFINQINVRLNQTAGAAMYINGVEVEELGEYQNPAEIYFFAEPSTITVKHYLPQR